jgi:hypothetical protein
VSLLNLRYVAFAAYARLDVIYMMIPLPFTY